MSLLATILTIVVVTDLLIRFCSDQASSRPRIVSHLITLGWSVVANIPLMITVGIRAMESDLIRQGKGGNLGGLVTFMSMVWAAPLVLGELFLCSTMLVKKRVLRRGSKRAGFKIMVVLSTIAAGSIVFGFWGGLWFFLLTLSQADWFPSVIEQILTSGFRAIFQYKIGLSLYGSVGMALAAGVIVLWSRYIEGGLSAPDERPDRDAHAPSILSNPKSVRKRVRRRPTDL